MNWRLIAVVLFLSCGLWAQTSNVTAQITDPDSQTWNNGNVQVLFIPAPGIPPGQSTWSGGSPFPVKFTATMNGSGTFTVSIPDNNFITPRGSSWQFTLCSNTSAPCQNTVTTVTGASPNLSATLSAQIIAPRFGGGAFAYGYLDLEVINPTTGVQYFNVTNQVSRQWNGTAWQNGGGGAASFSSLTGGTNSSATMTCGTGCAINTSGSGTNTATGMPFSGNTAATNTNALVIGTAGSTTTSGIGQIAATQNRWTVGVPFPVGTMANTGGSLANGHGSCLRQTFNSAAGQTLPGGELCSANGSSGSFGSACVSTTCTLTITAPSIPAGYTGYSVYHCDYPSGNCSNSELLVSGCSNITTNCVITTPGSGAALPTTNTAYSFPSPLGTNTCTPGTNPQLFSFDGTNNYIYAGVDNANTGVNPPAPYNKIVFCRPLWFVDSGTDPPLGRNAFVLINHLQNGTITNAGNQDRGLQINAFNCIPVGSCADSTTHYALEGIQGELDIMGSPTINGSPDGEVSMASFQTGLYATTSYTTNGFGTNAGRFTLFRQASAATDGGGMNGINVAFSNASTVTGGSATANAVRGQCANSVAISALGCNAFSAVVPNTANAFSNTVGLGQTAYAFPSVAAYTPRAGVDWFLRNENSTDASQLAGLVYLEGIQNTLQSILPVSSPISVQASISMLQNTAPTGPVSVSCAGGASQYGYTFVGVDGNGGQVVGSQTVSASTCVNPLTGGNPATVQYANVASAAASANLSQFQRVDIYRTAGPMATGKVGSLNCFFSAPAIGCSTFSDTGIAAGAALPSGNTTGSINSFTYQTNTNCSATGTAANPSVASCGSAAAGSFSCATNASAGTCQVNTTAVTANSEIFVTQRSDTTTGTRLGVTCNATLSTVITEITAVTAATSFTINLGTITTNPECFSYYIVN